MAVRRLEAYARDPQSGDVPRNSPDGAFARVLAFALALIVTSDGDLQKIRRIRGCAVAGSRHRVWLAKGSQGALLTRHCPRFGRLAATM